jgi:hydroxypyruvate isomerase
MLFAELPFVDGFAAAQAAGWSGVEYLFPHDFDKAELREQLQQHGLTQVQSISRASPCPARRQSRPP